MIFEISSDYTEIVEKHQELTSMLKQKREGDKNLLERTLRKEVVNEESFDETANKKRLIPKKGLFDFKVLPVNNLVKPNKKTAYDFKSLLKKKK
jgi:hypothetical protein